MARGATYLAVGALGAWLASLLWRTSVPHVVEPKLDATAVFGTSLVHSAASYARFLRLAWVLLVLAQLGVLAAVLRRSRRLRLGLGPTGTGLVLAAVAVTASWGATLPFGVAALWWRRRHGVVHESYGAFLVGRLVSLAGTATAAYAAVAIAMGLAALLGRRWWLGASPAATIAALVFVSVGGLLAGGATAPAPLRVEERQLAALERVDPPRLLVVSPPDGSRAGNAEAIGVGATRRIILWRTLLRPPFGPPEVRFVLAHELAHHARHHLWKGLAWFALLSVPVAWLLGRAAGDLRAAHAVPAAILTLAAAQLALLPLTNAISRRYEAEADWIGLRATHDPAAARALFIELARTGLQQPDPPGWAYVFLEDHPTLLQRVELALSSPRASPGGS
jgi:STE24 endopeptidase